MKNVQVDTSYRFDRHSVSCIQWRDRILLAATLVNPIWPPIHFLRPVPYKFLYTLKSVCVCVCSIITRLFEKCRGKVPLLSIQSPSTIRCAGPEESKFLARSVFLCRYERNQTVDVLVIIIQRREKNRRGVVDDDFIHSKTSWIVKMVSRLLGAGQDFSYPLDSLFIFDGGELMSVYLVCCCCFSLWQVISVPSLFTTAPFYFSTPKRSTVGVWTRDVWIVRHVSQIFLFSIQKFKKKKKQVKRCTSSHLRGKISD